MKNSRVILKQVGIVLILTAILNTICILYLKVQTQSNSSYSFILNILAVVGGVLLFRGNQKTLQKIRLVAAFLLSRFVSWLFILLPLDLITTELWLTEIRLSPVSFFIPLLIEIITGLAGFWVYTKLKTLSVVGERVMASHSVSTPKLAFILGIVYTMILVVFLQLILRGETGAKAIEIAQIQYGNDYKYHVRGIRWQNNQVQANLIAYNEREIKPLEVKWSK
ncbi:MAG: hypothetical protein F6K22_32265 [Okeania sp. SIO2F4]|uniref:hypothetical protein n=1 Tax=Okeania sp. SIO2F4 TaxID=2607790 RepID=UPI00142D1199|nr:hypothetical protein [Okeania sp. SIO2F4]NES07067.1 hypothetical protein [Okeania sp. SIO2F4]